MFIPFLLIQRIKKKKKETKRLDLFVLKQLLEKINLRYLIYYFLLSYFQTNKFNWKFNW